MPRGGRPHALIIALTIAVGGALAIAAPPQVEIRAQTKLVLDKVRVTPDGAVEIRGQLRDNLSDEGFRDEPVSVRIGDAVATARTGPDGRFRVTLDVPSGPQQVELTYEGSQQLNTAQMSQLTDPARAQVSLELTAEEVPGGVKLSVTATADEQPTKLPVALSIGPSSSSSSASAPPAGAPAPSDKLTPLTQLDSGAAFVLTRKAAGGAGTYRVRAAFAGDESRQPASSEKSIELIASSTTTMAVSGTRIAYEDDLGVTGSVVDEDGRPVSRASVTLASGDRRLAQGATSEDGSYRFTIEGEIFGKGQWGIQVQADPGKPSIKPSRAEPQIIRVAAPQPVPVSYTIAAFLATAAAAGGFFAARSKPWQRLRRPAPPAEAPAAPAAEDRADGGLVAARPGIVSTLRRPSDDGFSGVVRDTVRARPVPGALVRLRFGTPDAPPSAPPANDLPDATQVDQASSRSPLDRHTRAGDDGSFALESLPAGNWAAEVSAEGHVTETFVLSIPHRGELRGVRVDLVPVRERVFQLYRRAAEPVLPETRLWGVWSPRQIVDHVRSVRPSPALAELTDFVEEVYFSPRIAAETVLPQASEQVDRAIRERARPG